MHRKKGEQNTMFFRYWKIIKKWKINFKQKEKKKFACKTVLCSRTFSSVFFFFLFAINTKKKKYRKIACSVIFMINSLKFEDKTISMIELVNRLYVQDF